MNMFCANCGSQIPDDARFCSHCGKVITSAELVEQHTAPYTVPVGQGDAYREQMWQAQQQQPSQTPYTVPLSNEAQYIPPQQQYPQYTAPVDSTSQPGQHTLPVDRPPVYASPVPETPEHTHQKNADSGETVSRKKPLRKKRIVWVAIVVVLVIALMLIFGYIILSQPTSEWRGILSPRQARSLQRWVLSLYRGLLSLFR